MKNQQDADEIRKIPKRASVHVGKPQKIVKTAMLSKTAFGASSVGGSAMGSGGNFYSPELSTDFLELPQSLDEQRNYYRFFYRNDPFVGQAIDLHTELPLSRIRLGMPKAENRAIAEQALDFCVRWAKRVGLLHRMIEIVHDYHLVGEVFTFCEDTSPDMPEDVTYEIKRELDKKGNPVEKKVKREDHVEREVAWLKKNYKGWTAIRVLPPEQIHMESFPFTDQKLIQLIPDSKTKDLISRADMGDPSAKTVAKTMPEDVVKAIRSGDNIPLNTDPDAGSFVHYMARKKSQYEPRGHSILERCIRTLVYRDKLRQAQTSIASRHMTPIRIVYAEDMDATDVEELRDQIDLALADPDYSIVANYQINWEEMGADSRLLNLDGEYELSNRQLYAGLGVTEGLLSGESSHSGERISLEVINTRYMLLRELLQDMVEENMLKPMCRRMGFIETTASGEDQVIYPTLSFTRLAIRDNRDTFDALFNLYQKGSLDVDVILELLNIDPVMTREKLKKDLFTLQDSTFNEVLRSVYGDAARDVAENSDAAQRIAAELGLIYEKKQEDANRF